MLKVLTKKQSLNFYNKKILKSSILIIFEKVVKDLNLLVKLNYLGFCYLLNKKNLKVLNNKFLSVSNMFVGVVTNFGFLDNFIKYLKNFKDCQIFYIKIYNYWLNILIFEKFYLIFFKQFKNSIIKFFKNFVLNLCYILFIKFFSILNFYNLNKNNGNF